MELVIKTQSSGHFACPKAFKEVVMDIVLVNNAEKYAGNYVATTSFQDKDPICFGRGLLDVYREAVKMGVKNPVVFYVPEKDVAHLYYAN
jgi:hypothetical protein